MIAGQFFQVLGLLASIPMIISYVQNPHHPSVYLYAPVDTWSAILFAMNSILGIIIGAGFLAFIIKVTIRHALRFYRYILFIVAPSIESQFIPKADPKSSS